MSGTVFAQKFPEKPVKIIVPFAPGGGADMLARTLTSGLTETWGQPVVVENRAGASGNIGAEAVARSEPDGYTLLLTSSAFVISPGMSSNLPFNVEKDFAPITLAAELPNVLVVHPSVKANTVKELEALIRANATKISYASPGNGTGGHLAAELFKQSAGVEITHVPYKGGGPASIALISGEISMIFGEPATIVQQVRSGKLRAIAVTSAARAKAMPELPTLAESGIADYEVTSWNGVLAPAATPREIVNRLNAEFNRMIAAPSMQARMLEFGFEPTGGTPERFGSLIRDELAKWAPVVKAAGIKID